MYSQENVKCKQIATQKATKSEKQKNIINFIACLYWEIKIFSKLQVFYQVINKIRT
jgi:hypothetical protein